MRLALVTAALVMGSAVAVALVIEPTNEQMTTTTMPTPPASTTPLFDPAMLLTPATTVVVATTLPPSTTVPEDITPPLLEISSPRNGAEVHKPEVTFLGTTEPGALVTAGKRAADVDEDGSWSLTLPLSKGANQIEFNARDAAGNVALATITVHYAQVAETTTTTKPTEEPAEFVANASFGVCTLTPPYDVYYGTGEPGSTIYVQSEYGSGAVAVNGEGVWELQVFFPEAPAGQAFQVKVYDDLGREKFFEFKYQPEG